MFILYRSSVRFLRTAGAGVVAPNFFLAEPAPPPILRGKPEDAKLVETFPIIGPELWISKTGSCLGSFICPPTFKAISAMALSMDASIRTKALGLRFCIPLAGLSGRKPSNGRTTAYNPSLPNAPPKAYLSPEASTSSGCEKIYPRPTPPFFFPKPEPFPLH